MVSSVQVAVRVRPPFQTNQIVEDVCVSAIPQTRQITVGNVACFTVDYAFPWDTSQSSLYDTCVADLINCFTQGNDITIIAFGKYNSGKRYSLFGPLLSGTANDSSHGIILRATQQIFNSLSRTGKPGQFKVFISFIEMVDKELNDLLDTSFQPSEQNDKDYSTSRSWENVQCHNFNKVFNCIKTAIESRANIVYSPGKQPHSVFTFTLQYESGHSGRLEKKEWKCAFVIVGDCDCEPESRHVHNKMNNNSNCGIKLLSEMVVTASQDKYHFNEGFTVHPLLNSLIRDGLYGRNQTLVLCCVSPATSDYCDTLSQLSIIDKLRLLHVNSNRLETQPTTDVFGLEFAVSQWERLVSDAEGLFHKLIENGLPKEAKTQIEQWLCLKQECADCLVSDDSAVNFRDKISRSLERIDEVTECEEISTDERSSSCDTDSADESCSQLDSDSLPEDDTTTCLDSLTIVHNKIQDFDEKLELCVHKFRENTHDMVDKQLGTKYLSGEMSNLIVVPDKDAAQIGAVDNPRRKSIMQLESPVQPIYSPAYNETAENYGFGFDEDNPNTDKTNINSNNSHELNLNFQCYEKNITEKYKAFALNYEKKLQDLEVIKQLAGDSAKKVADMENNLQNSKKRMQKLVKLLKKTEEHKYSLEKTIIEDQKRINELEEKCKLQFKKPMHIESVSKESKDIVSNDSQQSSEDRRKTSNKESLRQVSSEDCSKKISTKESLRQEIINLRKTREFLLDERKTLDTKLNKDKVFTNAEERKFLELDEAIEAIDTAIEYKNEIMCGHNILGHANSDIEKGEELLMERLMNLSEQEMRLLLYKYFRKVIDLRESGRRLEQQLADQDHQIETQTWKIRALSNAVQKAHIENERRLVMIHREHDEKLHLMFRHFGGRVGVSTNVGGETSTTTTTTGVSSVEREEMEKVETLDSQSLMQLPSSLPKAASSKAITIPQQNLKKLQGSLSTHTTKVTRKKNKLIIQQHKSKQMP